jgi:hypothetical protein
MMFIPLGCFYKRAPKTLFEKGSVWGEAPRETSLLVRHLAATSPSGALESIL